jgi:O-antigen/teichoic acid export membrane protein
MQAEPLTAAPTQDSGNPSGFSLKALARNISSSWAGLLINLVIGLGMMPFVVHHLGDAAYGIWALVLQMTGYMGVVDVGLQSALIRFVARFEAAGDNTGLSELLSTVFAVFSALALACLGVGTVLAVYVMPHMHIAPGMLAESRIALLCAAGTMASGFVLGMFTGVLVGLSRWDLHNATGIGALLVRTLLIILFLRAGYGLVAVSVIHFLTSTAGYGAAALLARRFLRGVKISWWMANLKVIRPFFVHSFYSFLIGIGNRINYQVDTIVIAAFLPIQYVTVYVIGLRLPEYIRSLMNAVAQVMAPVVSGLDARGKTEDVKQLLLRGTKCLLLVGYPVTVAAILLGPPFIRLWMGAEYAEASRGVLIILAVGLFGSFTEYVAAHALYGLSKHRANVWYTSMECVVNLGMSLLLVRRYGIYGVALGTTVSIFLREAAFTPAYLRILRVHWYTYVWRAILPVFLPTLFFASGVLLFRAAFGVGNYLTLALAAISGLALYVPCVWVLSLDQEERALLRRVPGQVMWNRRVATGASV